MWGGPVQSVEGRLNKLRSQEGTSEEGTRLQMPFTLQDEASTIPPWSPASPADLQAPTTT